MQTSDVTHNNNQRDSLEDHPLFTPDLEYFTPLSTMSLDNTNAYQPRTLTPYNLLRHTILPVFLPPQSLINTTMTTENIQPPLLLCNVPKQDLSVLQLACREPNAYVSSFELIENNLEMIDNRTDSFMISIYRQLLYDLSKKWNISIPLLDFNFVRLRQCAKKCLEQLQQQQRQEQLQLIPHIPTTATFSIEEMPVALELYLQIDVDLFYFKTCWYRQAKPIEENIFCSKLPEIHYTLQPCDKSQCSCCQPLHPRRYSGQRQAIQFNLKEKFQFLHGYQAILNCPATCETTNIIYVLTCPCEQFEYVGVTTMSFRDCLTEHRQESNRIVREFIFGSTVTHFILQGIKSEEKRKNDRMWLYQHTARCPVAIQLFLDANPDYWCLIPMTNEEAAARINTHIPPSYQRNTSMQIAEAGQVRIEADVKYLTEHLPDPPESFVFTNRQKYAQTQFFRTMKDQLSSNTNVDLYNASIIAVLPENCSEMLRQLVLSLFITHADCDLNKTGRLLDEEIFREYPFRGYWCANLVRRPDSSLL